MPMTEPEGVLERALIREYLLERGYGDAAIAALAEADRIKLLSDASKFASDRLAEIEARQRLLGALRHSE